MSEIRLSEINIYPVKSLAGIPLSEAKTEERGLRFDRRWMLVDEKGKFFTQREFPAMATLKTALETENLLIENKRGEQLRVPFAADTNEQINVKIWASTCKANVYSTPINAWLSENLETNCRLVFMPDETRRIVNPFYAVRKYKDVVSFADGYPFLLIGENSLKDLNEKLVKPVPMNRFRPNFVATGAAAFAEDNWKKLRIGETVFHAVKPCARCVMTTVDQERGEFDGRDPLKTLASYRTVRKKGENKVLFGQNLIAENPGGALRVGDIIQILE